MNLWFPRFSCAYNHKLVESPNWLSNLFCPNWQSRIRMGSVSSSIKELVILMKFIAYTCNGNSMVHGECSRWIWKPWRKRWESRTLASRRNTTAFMVWCNRPTSAGHFRKYLRMHLFPPPFARQSRRGLKVSSHKRASRWVLVICLALSLLEASERGFVYLYSS
jgi:hypothetical protein